MEKLIRPYIANHNEKSFARYHHCYISKPSLVFSLLLALCLLSSYHLPFIPFLFLFFPFFLCWTISTFTTMNSQQKNKTKKNYICYCMLCLFVSEMGMSVVNFVCWWMELRLLCDVWKTTHLLLYPFSVVVVAAFLLLLLLPLFGTLVVVLVVIVLGTWLLLFVVFILFGAWLQQLLLWVLSL